MLPGNTVDKNSTPVHTAFQYKAQGCCKNDTLLWQPLTDSCIALSGWYGNILLAASNKSSPIFY